MAAEVRDTEVITFRVDNRSFLVGESGKPALVDRCDYPEFRTKGKVILLGSGTEC